MTEPPMTNLHELAGRVEAGEGFDNALDMEIEIALFDPDHGFVSVRPNHAGTKLIYTDVNGRDHTHWAMDWTMDRPSVAAALRARSLATQGQTE